MEKTFRAILLEHLETENEPSHQAPPSLSNPTVKEFNFAAVEFNRPRPQMKSVPSGYNAPTSAKTAVRPSENGKNRPQPAAPARPEPLIDPSQLSAIDRILADRLIELGAAELKGGLSIKRLKKAHRRLAKIWHPDTRAAQMKTAPESAAVFMEIQTAYKTLESAFSRVSESACGNESASAQGSQHRDAA